MRKARALAPAALVVACFACTYNIDALSTGGGGAEAGDDVAEAASADGPSDGDDASTQGGDASSEGAATDGGPKPDGPCTGLLCPCQNGSDCASRICALSLTVGQPLYNAAGNASFCTRPCCTSTDCDPGTVCFASGQGGSYCVRPTWLGRSASSGSAPGGSACTSDGQCRSGLCVAAACADTCCSLAQSGAECVNGEQCNFGSFPGRSFDTHFSARCGPAAGLSGYGTPCGANGECQGGLCYNDGTSSHCTNPCHSAGECGGGSACQLDQQGSDIYAACFPTTAGETGPQGASCTNNTQCVGAFCDTSSLCSNICVTDVDCTVAGWYCNPQPDTAPTGGNYNVLVCGP